MNDAGRDSFDKIQLSPVADNPHLIHYPMIRSPSKLKILRVIEMQK